MKKLLIVFGTRPEAIKLCPLINELSCANGFKTIVCVTGQHRHMVDQCLTTFDVQPDYDLNLMTYNQTLPEITCRALVETGRIIEKEAPDMVVVQGDTTSVFAASVAAFYQKIPIGHVEAGLRTHDKYSPFPEEVNRRLTSCIAELHFAPTEESVKNLIQEGTPADRIILTGNTVIDALLWVRQKIRAEDRKYEQLKGIDFDKRVILVTGHRRENFGNGLANVFAALRQLAEKHQEIEIVYPVHLNPNVKGQAEKMLSGVRNISLLKPLDYEPFVYLMDHCHLIISDSGGIQEEAPSLGKPVLVTRDTTERPEAISCGAARLVGTSTEQLLFEAERLLNDEEEYRKRSKISSAFGDGRACYRIVKGLRDYFTSL